MQYIAILSSNIHPSFKMFYYGWSPMSDDGELVIQTVRNDNGVKSQGKH